MNMNKRLLTIVPIVAVIVVIVVIVVASRNNADGKLVASGTVEATDARLGFQAVGRLDTIAVDEGDIVTAGQWLARLDTVEMAARRQQAEAQADAAKAILLELERGSRSQEIAQARAALTAANNRLNDAERDLERAHLLRTSGAVSQEALDKAQVGYDIASSQAQQAQEQLSLLEQGPRAEKITAQRALVAQAEAAVRTIDATLANMSIHSPFNGVVTVRHREPGETVPLGSPVLTVMNRDDRWVRIYIPENRIGAVHIGQPAEITFDTYPDKTYAGKVIYIASEAEFTPKSVQTSEERIKLVYAVKVQITEDPTYDLKPGVPADVEVDLNAS